ncbi:MAG: CHAT domain-containing protein [Chloracidobacterium sp.]|nr:CHAT domain-containing protein [Chloracidobacterium sp.]
MPAIGGVLVVLLVCVLPHVRGQETQHPLLISGKSLERELKGDDVHSYNLELTAGHFLNLVVEQKGIDVVVTLFDPNGKKSWEVDGPNGADGPEAVSIIAEISGNYRLEVRSLEKTATPAKYEIEIKELRISTEKDKSRVAAEQIFTQGRQIESVGTAQSLRQAIQYYEKTLTIFRSIGETNREADALNTIAVQYYSLGEIRKALEYSLKAVPLFHAVENYPDEGATLHNTSLLYYTLGEYGKSLEYLYRSLDIWKKLDNKLGEANALNGIAKNYSSLGESEKGLTHYQEALIIARTFLPNNKKIEAQVLRNLGGLFLEIGQNQKAVEHYNLALPIFKHLNDKHGESNVLSGIASVYKNSDSKTEKLKAIKFFEQALSIQKIIGDKNGEAHTLQNIGVILFDLGEKLSGIEHYLNSLIISREVGNKQLEAEGLLNLMIAYKSFGMSKLAGCYGKLSVNNLQNLRQSQQNLDYQTQKSFLRKIGRSYRELIDLLISQGRLAEAQQALNVFKDQQFFDFEQKQQLNPLSFTPREAEMVSRFDRIFNEIGATRGKISELRRIVGNRPPNEDEAKQLQQLELQLKTAKDELNNFIKQAEIEFAAPSDEKDKIPEIADLKEMQTAMRELSQQTGQKTAAVYQFVGDEKYSSLLITSDSIEVASYPIKGAELNRKALQLWKLLQSPESDPRPLAADLYKIVFAPLAPKLPKDTRTILWSLDGSLRYVPVAALYDGRNYLVEKYQNVLFTRADKERLTRQVSTHWTGAGFGTTKAHTVELQGKRFAFDALGQVTFEMGRIFKQADSKGLYDGDVLLDDKFTKSSMLAELKTPRSFVHISSHFRFEPGNEARSFLLLGDGDVFTLNEMKRERDLFKGVELLTLSACQTASQLTDANGREVDALAELAQRLGAGAVMASLWDVDDISTADLMSNFYGAYRKDRKSTGATKAQALQQAQLSLLNGQIKRTPLNNKRRAKDSENFYAEIKIDNAYKIPYKTKASAPLAHPFYWAPFVIFGNYK